MTPGIITCNHIITRGGRATPKKLNMPLQIKSLSCFYHAGKQEKGGGVLFFVLEKQNFITQLSCALYFRGVGSYPHFVGGGGICQY